jgi:nicotinamide mononucleotide (NMN) deamidase PncC
MITKTLVDLPGAGAVVYGGFVVYDTDAKRKFINVNTRGVYTLETADQMARGALENSRAMVGLAVTGDAMPFPTHKDNLGQVFIGVALRLNTGIVSFSKEVRICTRPQIEGMCDAWQNLTSADPARPKYAPFQMTSVIADYIRLRTVTEACIEAINRINNVEQRLWGELHGELYDGSCTPSWIIKSRVNLFAGTELDCNGDDNRSIYDTTI